MIDPNELFTGKEAADYLGVTPQFIYRLRTQKQLGQLIMGKFWMYTKTELDHYRNTRMGKRGRPKGYSPKRKKQEVHEKG